MPKLLDIWELELTRLRAEEPRARWRAAWDAWAGWWKRRESEIKTIAAIISAVTAILGSVETWWLKHGRDVPPAADTPRSGARMFVDRVEKPKS